MQPIIPTIQTPKCLQNKKCSLQKLLRNLKSTASKIYNFIIEHTFKLKTLSQFIRANVYMQPIIPTIQTLKRLFIKKFGVKKVLKILKPKALLHNKLLK